MPLSFTCPCCRAHLKVRDESAVGQTLECPECRMPLLLTQSPMGEVAAQQLVAEKPATTPAIEKKPGFQGEKAIQKQNPQPGVDSDPALKTVAKSTRGSHITAWVVVGVCLLGLISFLLIIDKPKTGQKDPLKPPVEAAESTVVEPSEKTGDRPLPDAAETPLPETPEGRLAALGTLVLDRALRDGHFPAGTVSGADLPVAHRWSWLAQLAIERDNPAGMRIDWNQRWSDPATDRFVRRPIPRFQNPQAEAQTSEDKYPASHFVGVAGVGADAPTLPANHPRAGIFGQDRKTKLEEIQDGASNTMLLVGVENHPGAWAEGASSYRAFTREPYIHGPDGFGTGQPKSMFVLMADGSVREMSSDVAPVIVRRMAAMNDGLPLDPKVPGEPADRPSPIANPGGSPAIPDKVPHVAEMPSPKSGPMPGVPPIKPDTSIKPAPSIEPEIVVNIPAALSRKILAFDQTKPAAAYQLLLQVEELSGVRIDYDRKQLGDAADRLDKPISLRMKNATLDELLSEILRQIDLGRKDEKSRIRIVVPT